MEIVKAGGLNPLLRLLQSPDHDSVYAAASCVSFLAAQHANGSPIIEAGFLQPLVNLMSLKDNERPQSRAARALRNLAGYPENGQEIVNAGAVQSVKELVLKSPVKVQINMTGCIRYLSRSGMDRPFDCLL